MSDLSLSYQIIPTTEAPAQNISVTLSGQVCLIRLYTRSIYVPIVGQQIMPSGVSPVYENQNPVFLDLYLNSLLVIGGVICLHDVKIVRDAYLGFIGDLSIIDTSGAAEDPAGVPAVLPPVGMRNAYEMTLARTDASGDALNGKAPPALANRIPGLGTRFLLTYWPLLT